MRHRQSGRQLNRNSSHRKALFMNMSNSLIKHELIKTTVPKAKELRRTIEPLITLSKNDNVANRRRAFARLRNKFAVGKLFTELGQRFQQRPGGYVRILKAGFRAGDNAPLAIIEFVDRLDVLKSKENVKDTTKKIDAKETVKKAEAKAPKKETVKKAEAKAPKKETVKKAEAKAPKKETVKKAEAKAPKKETVKKAEAKAPKKETVKKAEAKAPKKEAVKKADSSKKEEDSSE